MNGLVNRSLVVSAVGLFRMCPPSAVCTTWPDPLKALRLAGRLFLLMQPVLIVARAMECFSAPRRTKGIR